MARNQKRSSPARLERLQITLEKPTRPTILLLVFVAFIVAFGARCTWFIDYGNAPYTRFDDSYILTTHDGYAWADGTRDILEDRQDPRSRTAFPVSQLTAVAALALPLELGDIFVFAPPLLGSLLVIPIVLLGSALGSVWLGFAAAILAATAEVYLGRTIPGALDTDMLNVTLATAAACGTIIALQTGSRLIGLVGSLMISIGSWWYPSMWIVFAAMTPIAGVIAIFLSGKHSAIAIPAMMAGALVTQLQPIAGFIAPIAIYALWPLVDRVPTAFNNPRMIAGIGVLACGAIAIASAEFIIDKFRFYFLQTPASQGNFSFLEVQSMVAEMSVTDFGDTMGMLSGATPFIFVFAVIGMALMMVRRRELSIALPMIGLGLLAFPFGIRFGIFAVPWLALGLAYLVFCLANAFVPKFIRTTALVACGAVVVLQVSAARSSLQAPIILSPTAEAAAALADVAGARDLAITWWDYGYPLRYYSNANVVIDGGLMVNQQLLFAVSHALICGDAQDAGNLLRRLSLNVEQQGYRWQDDAMINALIGGQVIPDSHPANDTYLFLNDEMLDELGQIYRFCSVDPRTGETSRPPVITYFKGTSTEGRILRQQFNDNPAKGTVAVSNANVSQVIFAESDAQGRVNRTYRWRIRPGGNLTYIVRVDRGDTLLVDTRLLDSLVVQAFLLGNPPAGFEEVVSTVTARAWRIN